MYKLCQLSEKRTEMYGCLEETFDGFKLRYRHSSSYKQKKFGPRFICEENEHKASLPLEV